MARLRVRLELNRRTAGVPLDKLVSVVEETRKFFHLLAEDVHIDAERGEWLASDFDTESLNFTAEYSGAVTAEQVHAFGAAFAGATSLRRATIAQFTRIADFLGEDELVGFGLFQTDGETEPSEWRCLSKRDAQRFGQEIHMLAQAAGETKSETSLPSVMNGTVAGRRLFKDRREREAVAADPSKLMREVESNLSRRIGLLEAEVAEQTKKLRQVGTTPDLADERFKRLLSAMEAFWAQAPRQMPMLVAAPAPAPAVKATPALPTIEAAPASPTIEPAPAMAPAESPPTVTPVEPEPAPVETPVEKDAASDTVESQAQTADEVLKEVLNEVPAKKPRPNRWWMVGVGTAAAVTLSFTIPGMQREWSRYTAVESMPAIEVKSPAAPALPVAKVEDPKPGAPKAAKPKTEEAAKLAKGPQRFEGPQISMAIPADVRAEVPEEARVQVIVAIDEQGNVTNAEVASMEGQGARLLKKEALQAARRSRFRPAREGERPVESQMVLTYLFKPDSAQF
jgi:TonB family protein